MIILLTNDDGIRSPGLWAAAEELAKIAELWIVAPDKQCTSAGRSHGRDTSGKITELVSAAPGVRAFSVECTPAQCIHHAMLNIMPVLPDLVVSGINSGANISIDITRSGTVGAALEAANYGIPAMAVSLETEESEVFSSEPKADFRAAAYFCRKFAPAAAGGGLGGDVHVLKIEVPSDAGMDTLWKLTSLARRPYYLVSKPEGSSCGHHSGLAWHTQDDYSVFQDGTDAHTLLVERKVAVTPLSLDLTSRISLGELKAAMEKELPADNKDFN
ncbi:MAG: 5'/3'-nucleotidase SurE [Spirochaetales bacterium]|nr:5'/3'-nucleotidase SurE [Spirochaetales bacterium]